MITGARDTRKQKFFGKLKMLLCTLAVGSALAGCAAQSASVDTVFFPAPPEEPRVQFLTGISSSMDLKEKAGNFSKLLVGGTETVTRLSKPYGLVEHNGKLYICDVAAGQVVVVDFAAKTMKNLIDERGSGRLKKPISVAVDEEGLVYVADSARKDIAVYSQAGKFLKSYGKAFENESIIGVAIYKDDLYALDNRLGKVFVLDRKTGELQQTIGDNPDRTKNLALPNGITVDHKGMIRVVNVGNGTVKEYDRDGNMLSVFGRLGDRPGDFTRPRGVAVDADGDIYVVDAGHQVVQVFNSERRILGYFGQPGLPAGSTNLPAGVVVSTTNLDLFQKMAAPGFKLRKVIFVTNQYSSPINHSLAVYGLGEMEGYQEREKARAKEDAEIREQRKKALKKQQPPAALPELK